MEPLRQGTLPRGRERVEFLDAQPTYWVKRCYQALRRSVDADLRAYGLTLSQRDVLLTLYADGPLDQRALREKLGLEQSSVSRLVDGLARRGLVELRPGRADRRMRVAELTPAGEALLKRTPGSSQLAGSAMVADLNDAERRELIRLLRLCTNNLERDTPNGKEAGND